MQQSEVEVTEELVLLLWYVKREASRLSTRGLEHLHDAPHRIGFDNR